MYIPLDQGECAVMKASKRGYGFGGARVETKKAVALCDGLVL
jgi:hypothetical protein